MTAPERSAGRRRPLLDEAFLHRLERLTLRTRRIAGLSGGRTGALRVPAADFVDHRPYSPGDDTRHIDWPAVARHDEVFVKIGRASQAADLCLLLDTSSSMAADDRKEGLALEMAAALGWMALHAGDRVTVVPFPAARSATWGPATGSGKGPALLEHLRCLQRGAEATTMLEPAVRRATRRVPTGGVAVVVSDLWLADDLQRALALVPAPRWDVLVLQVLGRAELAPEMAGAVSLVDAESGRLLDLVVDEALLAAYRAALHARLDRVRAVVAGRAARLELIPADWTLERAVIPYLQMRAVVGG